MKISKIPLKTSKINRKTSKFPLKTLKITRKTRKMEKAIALPTNLSQHRNWRADKPHVVTKSTQIRANSSKINLKLSSRIKFRRRNFNNQIRS